MGRFARLRLRTTRVGVFYTGGPHDGLSFVMAGDPDDLPYQQPFGDCGGYTLCEVAVVGRHGQATYRWAPARHADPSRARATVDAALVAWWWPHMLVCPAGFAHLDDGLDDEGVMS